ncbi:MAG: suppressor of fused domain protein [Planctomycetota bacterium]
MSEHDHHHAHDCAHDHAHDHGDDDQAQGWDAITRALEAHYGEQEPRHFGTVIKWGMGGPDPLDGLSCYAVDEPTPHWHIVSYGMTELYAKESDIAEQSGWGFEFTIRVARAPEERGSDDVPRWALSLLQNLARYVFASGNVFGPGHKADLNGPIALQRETALRAVAFLEDPTLPELDTPNGRVAFLQVVGLTADEYRAASSWDARKFLDALRERLPLAITDLARGSLLEADPAFAALVEEGLRRDGSSQESLAVPLLELEEGEGRPLVRLGARPVEEFLSLVRGRLPHGRPMWLAGPEAVVAFEPGEEAGWGKDPHGNPSLVLAPADVERVLAKVRPRQRGRYDLGFWILEVVPSEIKNQAGEVIEVIG